jgi:hypothetical protein
MNDHDTRLGSPLTVQPTIQTKREIGCMTLPDHERPPLPAGAVADLDTYDSKRALSAWENEGGALRGAGQAL